MKRAVARRHSLQRKHLLHAIPTPRSPAAHRTPRLEPIQGPARGRDRHRAELLGERLYGEDLSAMEIAAWHEDERESYAALGAADFENYRYVYHALNVRHGWHHIPVRSYGQALGIGSAWGDEFEPVASLIEQLTVLEPSEAFVRDEVHGIPTRYEKPEVSGKLPFPGESFGLITCFGVLHHLPNPRYVLSEMRRCLQPGGFALVRESVVSMGDWSKLRPGLTKNERGIPLSIFREAVAKAGFCVERETPCMFPLVRRFAGDAPYLDSRATALDEFVSGIMRWNLRYHAVSRFAKLRPTSVYYVLTRTS